MVRTKDTLKREARELEHATDPEVKRMRTYSENNDSSPRRRTRSLDAAESEASKKESEAALSVSEWRKLHSMSLLGKSDFPDPFRRFEEAPFRSALQRALTGAGFAAPTPIQAQAWPIALQKHDMICIAKTGSGRSCRSVCSLV